MQFQVPQFIDIEDKIFGPLTFKQFVYLAGGAGLSFVLYSFLPLIVALPLIAAAAALSLALAFYKYNEKPFIFFLESFFRYITSGRLYVWKKEPKKIEPTTQLKSAEPALYVPKLSDSKLKDLSWSLDVTEYSGKNSTEQESGIKN